NLGVRAIRYLIHMRQVRLSLEKTRQQVSSILALTNQYLALVNQSALPGEDTVPSRDAGGDNN
ncbi:hypothetical protein L6258_03380, partial [Candidatus Parcubacteria bacterium]|nr:hypothetical protein [Candidatus Parcubacteria bacterium]